MSPWLDTDDLAAITQLTHQENMKATWPGDLDIRVGGPGDETLAIAEIRVGKIIYPPRIIRAVDQMVQDARGEDSRLIFPGQEDRFLGDYLAGVEW